MCSAKVDTRGRITIPVTIRDALALNPGDQVRFVKHRSEVRISKVKSGSIMDLHGIFKWKGKPVTIEEMNRTIADGWAGLLKFDD